MKLFVFLSLLLGGLTAGVDGLYFSLLLTLAAVGIALLGQTFRGDFRPALAIMLATTLIALQALLSSATGNPNFVPHVVKIVAFVLGASVIGPHLTWRDLRQIAKVAPPFFIMIALLVLVSGRGFYYGESARFGIPTFGSPNTTAFVGALCYTLTLYALAMAHRKGSGLHTLMLIAQLASIILIITATESDGSLLMVAVATAVFLRRLVPPLVLVLTGASVLAALVLHDFDSSEADLIGSGRLLIWLDLITQWLATPMSILIGVGPGGINLEPGFTEKVISAHSMYVETLFTFGLVGAVLLLTYLVKIFQTIRRALLSLPLAEGHTLLALFAMTTVGIAFDSYFLAAQLVWLGALVHGVFGLARRAPIRPRQPSVDSTVTCLPTCASP